MDLSIVIVNWKVRDLVMQLLQSIFSHTKGISFEIIVVDNASEDDLIEFLEKRFPQVVIIANTKNLGFAAACNQAIRTGKGEFVLLLNPDTEVFDDSFARMVFWMRRHSEVGISGGKILNVNGTVQKSVRRFPTLRSQGMIMLKLHHLFSNHAALQQYFAADFDYTKEQEVDQVIGAFFCIRRTVFEAIGLLDEQFFIWFEEVDFCKRTKTAGWKVVYSPEFFIIHHGGESFAQVFALQKQRYLNASFLVYARKHFGRGAVAIVRLLGPVSLFLAWLAGTLRVKPSAYRK